MTRKGLARCRAPRFVLENSRHRARDARPAMGLPFSLTRLIGIFGALARGRLGLAFSRRTKGDACPPGLREADGDGLFRRSGAMLAAADLVDLFANEFTSLSRGRLARALVPPCLLGCSFVRNHHSPTSPITGVRLVPRGAAPHAFGHLY